MRFTVLLRPEASQLSTAIGSARIGMSPWIRPQIWRAVDTATTNCSKALNCCRCKGAGRVCYAHRIAALLQGCRTSELSRSCTPLNRLKK